MPFLSTYFTCIGKKSRKRYTAKSVVSEKGLEKDMVQIVRNFILYVVFEFLQQNVIQKTESRKMARGKAEGTGKIITNC